MLLRCVLFNGGMDTSLQTYLLPPPHNGFPCPTAPCRAQFGDRLILSYLTHQRRLFVGLATTYGEDAARASGVGYALQQCGDGQLCCAQQPWEISWEGQAVGMLVPPPPLPSPLRLRSFPPGHAAAEAGGGQGARRCIRCCHRTACALGFLTFLESAGACWISTVLVCYPNNDSVSLAVPAPPIPLLQGGPDAAKQIHIVSSGLKAGATWHRVKILQDCRECCGGECRLWLATACGWQLRATPACKGWMLRGLRQCVCG